MARYFFTTAEGGAVRDGAGIDLRDLNAARRMATDFAGELVKEIDGDLFKHDLELRVTDDAGLLLFLVTVVATEAPAIGRASSAA